jgi:hypothetical protein
MRATLRAMLTAMLAVLGLAAQTIKLPIDVEKLSSRAKETVEVTMDGSMLRFAERFLSDKDPDQSKAKRILRGLNSVHVRVFEFDRDGEYDPKDLEAIRQQFRGPEWSRMVQVKGLREHTEVFARMQGSEMNGLVVVAAEGRELAIVHIDGPIRPEEIASISGHIGLGRWHR